MIKKNDEFEVEIIDNGYEGEGIAKIEKMTIFVPETIKGEIAKIKILKVNKNYCFAKVLEIHKKSEHRACDDCENYPKCGGCNFRHIEYQYSLEMKKEAVQNTLKKALGEEIKINTVIGMDNPYYYRNKLQYPVGIDDKGDITMGVFAKRSHRIIENKDCKIQNLKCQKLAKDCFEFLKEHNISGYNEETRQGLVRHIIVRIGVKTDELMLTIVLNDWNLPDEEELVKFLKSENPELKTIVKNLNNKNTNVILGNENRVIFGDGHIFDYIKDKKFKISPMSFYQVNPVQTEKLYSKAIEFAELTGNETIFDLYCGIGTIGICASSKAKKLYGIETVEQAIEDAKENAKLNDIQNAEFLVRRCGKCFAKIFRRK